MFQVQVGDGTIIRGRLAGSLPRGLTRWGGLNIVTVFQCLVLSSAGCRLPVYKLGMKSTTVRGTRNTCLRARVPSTCRQAILEGCLVKMGRRCVLPGQKASDSSGLTCPALTRNILALGCRQVKNLSQDMPFPGLCRSTTYLLTL